MANPSISAFMRPELKEETIVTIPGIKTFTDEHGKPIDMKIRVITTGDLSRIRKACHTRKIAKDAKGKPIFQNGQIQYDDQYDGNAMNDQMIAESRYFLTSTTRSCSNSTAATTPLSWFTNCSPSWMTTPTSPSRFSRRPASPATATRSSKKQKTDGRRWRVLLHVGAHPVVTKRVAHGGIHVNVR